MAFDLMATLPRESERLRFRLLSSGDLGEERMSATIVTLLLIVGVLWATIGLVRWAKKGTRGSAVLAAMAFPLPDQPPPHEVVQDAIRKNGAESGAPPAGSDSESRSWQQARPW